MTACVQNARCEEICAVVASIAGGDMSVYTRGKKRFFFFVWQVCKCAFRAVLANIVNCLNRL